MVPESSRGAMADPLPVQPDVGRDDAPLRHWSDLRRMLRVERTDGDTFRAPVVMQPGADALYGGLVAALALLAAGNCVEPDRVPHSLHAYFLRPATDAELRLDVRRVRDGRAFSVRQVEVYQKDRLIFMTTTSFHRPEPGDDWYHDVSPVLAPEEVAQVVPTLSLAGVAHCFEVRHFSAPRPDGYVPLHPMWLRHRFPLPDGDQLLRAAALAFVSDLGMVAEARPLHSTLDPGHFYGASVDHAVWFHRPAPVDDWLLFASQPVNSIGGRALAGAAIRDRAGRLVATVLQEGLHRR
jgi:acyl-CoA thioesterase-2